MMQADRINDYLQRLTPLARSNLLTELERLEVCGNEIQGSAALLATLRGEFRSGGQTHKRVVNPSRHFFAPLELLLVDGAPEHANSGRILRGSLAPIWEWINQDLLPTMARDYIAAMKPLIAADNQQEARKVAAAFQNKVVKYLESTLGSSAGVDRARGRLATYTASPAAFGDLIKMLNVLRARDALARFSDSLPASIEEFDDAQVSKAAGLLDGFGKSHAGEISFALALVARRLKTPWQLIRLATKAAPSKSAAAIAATPYAIAVSMVLDRLEDRRWTLRVALRDNRVAVAKEVLTDIYDTEYALRVRIDLLAGSDWRKRLDNLTSAVDALVNAEIARFPANVHHVLGARRLHSHDSWSGRLTHLAWKGRDAIGNGAAYCRKIVGQPERPRG